MKCTRRPEAAEIRFLRALLGLTTLDKIRNTETEATTRKKKNILKEIEEYRSD